MDQYERSCHALQWIEDSLLYSSAQVDPHNTRGRSSAPLTALPNVLGSYLGCKDWSLILLLCACWFPADYHKKIIMVVTESMCTQINYCIDNDYKYSPSFVLFLFYFLLKFCHCTVSTYRLNIVRLHFELVLDIVGVWLQWKC